MVTNWGNGVCVCLCVCVYDSRLKNQATHHTSTTKETKAYNKPYTYYKPKDMCLSKSYK